MPIGIYKRTKEHKEQAIKNLGNGMKGKHLSKEHKKKLSKLMKGSQLWKKSTSLFRNGKENPAWKGGRTLQKDYYRSEGWRRKNREWNKTHRQYRNYMDMIRRMKLRNIEGSFTREQWEDLKEKYNYTCLKCGEKEPKITLSIDHVIPISQGGDNYITNIQPLCRSCNSSKGKKVGYNFIIPEGVRELKSKKLKWKTN